MNVLHDILKKMFLVPYCMEQTPVWGVCVATLKSTEIYHEGVISKCRLSLFIFTRKF